MKKSIYALMLIGLITFSCKKESGPDARINPTFEQTSNQEWGGEDPASVIRTLSCRYEPHESGIAVLVCSCWYPAYDCMPTFVVTAPKPDGWIDFEDAVGSGKSHLFFGTLEAQNMFSELSSSQLDNLQDSTVGFMKTPVSFASGEYHYVAASKAAIAYYDSVYNCNALTGDSIQYNECIFEKVKALKDNGEVIVVIPARDEE